MHIQGLLVVDLDGTLVHRGMEIFRRDIEALRAARSAGLLPVVATGRRIATGLRFARDLGLRDSPLVACDGALVRGPDGEIWRAEAMPQEVAVTAAELCRRYGVAVGFSTRQRLYVQLGRQRLHPLRHLWRRGALRSPARLRRALWDLRERTVVRGRFEAAAAEEVYKIDLFGPGAAEARDWLLSAVGGVRETMPFGPLELVAENVDKALGVECVLARYGLCWEQVLAIGNDWNDAEMIRRAGFGVAMGDAPRPVREAARHVTGRVREGGAAEAIERYLALQGL